MSDCSPAEWRTLLEQAVAVTNVTDVARRLGVARSSLSLVINGKYPGGTGKMEQRIMEILGQPCPVYGGTRGPEACASRRAASMPTSNPYALRQSQRQRALLQKMRATGGAEP